ncbi:MAG: HEAT repeat domain-containing protein [Planctomycetota bacterium]|nr:MAG: HEAT repeat domain-containing protein [Planctomycetota bacterium]
MRTTLAASLLSLALLAPPHAPLAAQGRTARVASQDELARAPADVLLAEVAAARLALDVAHDAKLVEAQLNMSWVRTVNLPAFDRQIDVLIAIMEARADLFARSGQPERVAQALTELLPNPAELAKTLDPEAKVRFAVGTPGAATPPALAAAVEAALAGPKVAALRARYAPNQVARADEKLVTLVGDYIQQGHYDSLQTLGQSAAPALEELIVRAGKFGQQGSFDPLVYLAGLSPSRAATVVERLGLDGGAEWTSRVVMLLIASELLKDDSAWVPDPAGGDPAFRHASDVWLRFLELHAPEPGFLVQSLGPLQHFVRHDALSPALRAALGALVRGDDQGLATRVVETIRTCDGKSARAVLRIGMESKFTKVRQDCARALRSGHRDVEGLLAKLRDPDESVRAEVASVLAGRSDNNFTPPKRSDPEIGERELQALRELARDSSSRVRSVTAHVLASNVNLLAEQELALALIRDPVLEVRMPLVDRGGDAAAVLQLLEIAATQPEPAIVSRVQSRLRNFVTSGDLSGTSSNRVQPDVLSQPGFVRALTVQLRNPVDAPLQEWTNYGLLDELMKEAAVRAVAVEVAPRNGKEVAAVFTALGKAAEELGAARVFGDLPPEQLRTLAKAAPPTQGRAEYELLSQFLSRGGQPLAAAVEPLIADAALSADQRLLFVAAATAWLGKPAHANILAVAADPAWTALGRPEFDSNLGARIADRGTCADAGELQRKLLAANGAQPDLVRAILVLTAKRVAMPDDVARKVLQLPFTEHGRWERALGAAFDGLRAPLDDATAQRLLTDEVFPFAVVSGAIGRLRDPRFLPRLRAGLLIARRQGGEQAERSIDAVVNYLNDDAVEILLEIAAQNADMRANCLVGLATIRSLREEKDRWNGRATSEVARAKALDELVPLLDSSDDKVRAGAATSIGSLGGVEHSPRLVKLLQDKSPLVREAAQKAIDRLAAAPTGAGREPGK